MKLAKSFFVFFFFFIRRKNVSLKGKEFKIISNKSFIMAKGKSARLGYTPTSSLISYRVLLKSLNEMDLLSKAWKWMSRKLLFKCYAVCYWRQVTNLAITEMRLLEDRRPMCQLPSRFLCWPNQNANILIMF